MKALLKTYTLDTLTETEVVEIPENYDGDHTETPCLSLLDQTRALKL